MKTALGHAPAGIEFGKHDGEHTEIAQQLHAAGRARTEQNSGEFLLLAFGCAEVWSYGLAGAHYHPTGRAGKPEIMARHKASGAQHAHGVGGEGVRRYGHEALTDRKSTPH